MKNFPEAKPETERIMAKRAPPKELGIQVANQRT